MSGSTIGGVIGAAVGYYVGGSQGAQVGWMVGSAVGGYVDPDVIKGQRLTDAQQQTSAEGAPRPIIYGTAVVAGNIIHAGPLVEHKDRARTGKGGPVQESYRYTRSYAIRVCEGPIGNISRIWRDDKLVYDVRDPAQWPDAADAINALSGDTARFASGIAIYTGSETQLPDPTLEALPEEYQGGVGNVNAHRGTCYVVFADDDLTDRGGAIPQYRFEVACCGDMTSTQNLVDWVAGNDGTSHVVHDASINGLTGLIACDAQILARTVDGGVTWNAAVLTGTSLPALEGLVSVWHVEDPQESAGTWYVAGREKIVVSYDDGASFTDYITPVHDLAIAEPVFEVNGNFYAGAHEAANTIVFQVLNLGDTDIDLGADYGRVTALGDLGGTMIVGTSTGNIVSTDGTVRYTHPGGNAIREFAWGLNIAVAAVSGGYISSVDGGITWVLHSGVTTGGIVFARGTFYRKTPSAIYTSTNPADPASWVVASTILAGLETGVGWICTDGYSVLAVTQSGDTAVLPSAYVLPDIATGWHIDNAGNVVGDVVTKVDRCVAQLDATVLDICARAGVSADQVDVTQLTDDLRGFVIGQPISASDALRTLQQGFFFDFPEWGDWPDTATKLRAIKRGGASVFAITDDDCVESDEDEDTREQVVEFPRKINLLTSDVDSDYNPTKQTFARRTSNVKAVGEQTLQLALSTLRTEAAPMVDIMGKVAWEEALGRAQRDLPEDYSQYVPSDCGTLNGKRHRLEKTEAGDGTVRWSLVRDRASAYVSSATPSTAPPPTVPSSTLRGRTAFSAMNLPSLRAADNVPGMYVAVCGELDGWIGCELQLSVDGGLTFDAVATITNEATMGTLAAACDSGATDLITVSILHRHELDSVTLAQLAAKANGFAITTLGVSEVGQFQTATETATTGTYDLSDISRGQLGTTAAAHAQSNTFVLLDGNVLFLPIDANYAGQTLVFRPVSLGTAAANNRTYSVVFDPGDTVIDGGVVSDHTSDDDGPAPGTGGTGVSSTITARTHGATVVDPVTYGADPTGVTDSTAAFNDAYAALPGDGGIVRPSAGTYLIDPDTSVKPLSNTQLDLATNDVTLQESYTATDHKYGIWIDGVSQVEVVGGHIIGYRDDWSPIAGTTSEWGHCIFINNSAVSVSIKNVSISKAVGDAISIGYTVSDVKIDQCLLTNCRRQGISSGADNVQVTNSEISYISGTSPQAGIDIEPDYPATSNTTLVSACHIHHCAGPSVQMYKRGNDVTVQNCTLEYCNRGVYAVDSTGGIVKDNTIRYHLNSGVYLKGASTSWTIGGTGDANAFYGNKTGTYGTPAVGGATTTITGESAVTAKHLTIDTTASATVGSNTYGPT